MIDAAVDLWSPRQPYVRVRRESVWSMATPSTAADHATIQDRRHFSETRMYTTYADAGSISDLETVLMPVLTMLVRATTPLAAVLPVRTSTFHGALLRHYSSRCRGIGVSPVVELRGEWDRSALALLLTGNPDTVRLGEECVRGAATVPQQFRALVAVAEFAEMQQVTLVAPHLDDQDDQDALRIAGIGRFVRRERPEIGAAPADWESLGTAPPTVLRFPLRTTPR